MQLQAVGISHSPLMFHLDPADVRAAAGFRDGVHRLARDIRAFDPELVAIFAPDHFNGFHYQLMPPFCIGTEASSATDWGLRAEKLSVPAAIAEACASAVADSDIDVALSRRMLVDHGFTIPLRLLFERLDAVPTIPIFINCAAEPLPSFRRVRLLGEALGRYLARTQKRTLIIASGGLSHDPPHKGFKELPAEAREHLVSPRGWNEAQEHARQARVIDAARQLMKGSGPCRPPNRDWDEAFLNLLRHRDLARADRFVDAEVTALGGKGGHEVRTWVAAFAALAAAGSYSTELLYYELIPEWITGMALVRARAET